MPKKRKLREVVLDLETTGFDFGGRDRIMEIGVVELLNREPTGKEFRRIVNPGNVHISRRISEITGITNQDVKEKKRFAHPSVMAKLIEFIGEAKIVAHNASFDRNFLNAALRRAGEREIQKERWIDTVSLARKKLKLKKNTLDALCDHFEISRKSREKHHGALIDARLTAEVYKSLAEPIPASKESKVKKPNVIINRKLDFASKSTEYKGEYSSSWNLDSDTWLRDIEKHMQDATGLETKLNKILPNAHSASSHYFPLAVLSSVIFKLADQQVSMGMDEEKIDLQLEKDTETIHRLIDLAGTDIKSYYNKMHKFHNEHNSREFAREIRFPRTRRFEPSFEQKSLEILANKYKQKERKDYYIDEIDDEKIEKKHIPIPNYYDFADYACRSTRYVRPTLEIPRVDEVHQELVNHLYLATGYGCGLDWLLPEPHSASSPFFPIAVLSTAVLKMARVRIIMGIDLEEVIVERLSQDRDEISELIDLAGTDILSYFEKMHDFHVEYNARGYPDLHEEMH